MKDVQEVLKTIRSSWEKYFQEYGHVKFVDVLPLYSLFERKLREFSKDLFSANKCFEPTPFVLCLRYVPSQVDERNKLRSVTRYL